MKYSNIMREIKTVRDYKKDAIGEDKLGEILNFGKSIEGLQGAGKLDFLLVTDGKKMFENLSGKAGYHGKLIEAPHYLILTGSSAQLDKRNAGYTMELVRFKAWEMGIGTCWLSIEKEAELKEALKIEGESTPLAMISIGYQYKGIFKQDIQQKSFRQAAAEIVYMGTWGTTPEFEELEARGVGNIFYNTRLAPSWGNIQPWKFLINKDEAILTMKKESDKDYLIDSGIVMMYFEKACVSDGIDTKWETNIDVDAIRAERNIPNDYEIVGICRK